MAIVVNASWLFNRICDESKRREAELIEKANATDVWTIDSLELIAEQLRDIHLWEKFANDLRLDSTAEIQINNDHRYVKVVAKA